MGTGVTRKYLEDKSLLGPFARAGPARGFVTRQCWLTDRPGPVLSKSQPGPLPKPGPARPGLDILHFFSQVFFHRFFFFFLNFSTILQVSNFWIFFAHFFLIKFFNLRHN